MKQWGVLIFGSLLIILSCRNPLQEARRSEDTGSVTVSLSSGSTANAEGRAGLVPVGAAAAPNNGGRTVVPDYLSETASATITLTSNDGYGTLSNSVTASPWRVTFSEVRAGSWDVDVGVQDSGGSQIGAGSAANQILNPGATLTVPIMVTFSSTATTGDVGFQVSFPATTNIDYASGTIEETGDVSTPTVSESGGTRRATFGFTGLPADTYSLVFTFRRGGASGTSAGTFREKVIVDAGFTSGSWVAADGSLAAERVFAATDLLDNDSSLANLTVSGAVLPAEEFSSTTTNYARGVFESLASVTFTASASVPGQYLQYSWNGAPLAEIVPGTDSPSLGLIDDSGQLETDNTLEVVVTAPDRQTTSSYTVTLSRGYAVGYDDNADGAAEGSVPLDPSLYEAGQMVTVMGPADLVLPGYNFIGWTTASDPTIYSPGDLFTMPGSVTTFYAVWEPGATVTVDITFDLPSYGSIIFTSPTMVERGSVLSFTTSTLAGVTNWHWFVDNTLVSVSAPPFDWDTTGLQPGQYAINVDALYLGQPCTGSTVVTITYGGGEVLP